MESVNDTLLINVKVEGVIGILRVVRVARLCFRPADHLAHVLYDGFAFCQGLQREHAPAMHAGATDLNSARVGAAG